MNNKVCRACICIYNSRQEDDIVVMSDTLPCAKASKQ